MKLAAQRYGIPASGSAALAGSSVLQILRDLGLTCALTPEDGTPYEDSILFRKIGTPPAGPHEMVEVAADTATPYLASYDDADAGKTAPWCLCWQNSSGQDGPLSAVTS